MYVHTLHVCIQFTYIHCLSAYNVRTYIACLHTTYVHTLHACIQRTYVSILTYHKTCRVCYKCIKLALTHSCTPTDALVHTDLFLRYLSVLSVVDSGSTMNVLNVLDAADRYWELTSRAERNPPANIASSFWAAGRNNVDLWLALIQKRSLLE